MKNKHDTLSKQTGVYFLRSKRKSPTEVQEGDECNKVESAGSEINHVKVNETTENTAKISTKQTQNQRRVKRKIDINDAKYVNCKEKTTSEGICG